MILSTISCTCWSFVCLFWKTVCSVPLLLFYLDCLGFLLLSWISYNINLLSDIWLANIFSHSVDYHFILLIFAAEELLSLMLSHLFIFAFVAIALYAFMCLAFYFVLQWIPRFWHNCGCQKFTFGEKTNKHRASEKWNKIISVALTVCARGIQKKNQ